MSKKSSQRLGLKIVPTKAPWSDNSSYRTMSQAILDGRLNSLFCFEFDAILTNAELDTFWLFFFLVCVYAESNNSGYEYADDHIEEIAALHWYSPFRRVNETQPPEVPAENNFFMRLVFVGRRPRIPCLDVKDGI
jgi:hypothetical protein